METQTSGNEDGINTKDASPTGSKPSTRYVSSEVEKLTEGVERVELAAQPENEGKRRWASELTRVGDFAEIVELKIVGTEENPRAPDYVPSSSPEPSEGKKYGDKKLSNSLDEVQKAEAKTSREDGSKKGKYPLLEKITKLQDHYRAGLEMSRELANELEGYYRSHLNRLEALRRDFEDD